MFSEMIHAFFIYYRFIPSYVLSVCSGAGASKNRKNSVLHYAVNHLKITASFRPTFHLPALEKSFEEQKKFCPTLRYKFKYLVDEYQ